MHRKILRWVLAVIVIPALLTAPVTAQDRNAAKKSRIDVENYVIDAEVNPHTQALNANVKVRFLPLDNDISSVSFELNNALTVSSVTDDTGHQIPASPSILCGMGSEKYKPALRNKHIQRTG